MHAYAQKHSAALLKEVEGLRARVIQLEDLIDNTVDSLLVLGLQPSTPSSAVLTLIEQIAALDTGLDAALANEQPGE
jgi:hypothetical protein